VCGHRGAEREPERADVAHPISHELGSRGGLGWRVGVGVRNLADHTRKHGDEAYQKHRQVNQARGHGVGHVAPSAVSGREREERKGGEKGTVANRAHRKGLFEPLVFEATLPMARDHPGFERGEEQSCGEPADHADRARSHGSEATAQIIITDRSKGGRCGYEGEGGEGFAPADHEDGEIVGVLEDVDHHLQSAGIHVAVLKHFSLVAGRSGGAGCGEMTSPTQ
jgi:hypothetical protein